MAWFWLGFFALVAVLLALDLGVLHRKATEPTVKSAALWTAAWVAIGLAFSGVVYLIYEHRRASGSDAAITYVSAYLLEQALSVDNIFVIMLVFRGFRIPVKYQHRVLFWGILGAIGFRLTMLGGGSYLARHFDWIFYIFGGYLVLQGIKLLRGEDEDEEKNAGDSSAAYRWMRKFLRIEHGDFGGRFSVIIEGKRALTTVAVCLVVVELTDIVFAMDSIPAVLSVSNETFIMVTSNVFAILGLRSLYFVLAGAMAQFQYLKLALAVLLVFIGGKLLAHELYEMPHAVTLAVIAGVLTVGVVASVIQTRRSPPQPPIDPGASLM
jgi:tellurite resistance protein TerC